MWIKTCYLILIVFIISVENVKPPTDDVLRATKLPPCQACKNLVKSFYKGMERTARGKFEGGDADWEEKKLGSYMHSEVRLVEIQEGLCRDLTHGQDQCHSLADQYNDIMEEWWLLTKQKDEPSLETYLCILELKVCCRDKHFGPLCNPCPGYPQSVCSNNGKCRGSGTRKGNGTCACDQGYDGDLCSNCSKGYFQLYKDDNKLICDKCHNACQDDCTEAGPTGCLNCAKGWYKTSKGCTDQNECLTIPNLCKEREFCVNKEGSYSCLECDRSCQTCTGDGPDMCVKCNKGYIFENNMCIDPSSRERTAYVNMTRYITYLGLCVATCIIFQRNMVAASAIGLAVGLYITVAEYFLQQEQSNQSETSPIDMSQLQDLFT